MKKILFLLPVLFILFGFFSKQIMDDKLQTLLKQFNLKEDFAKSSILSAVSGPSYFVPNVKVLKNMALDERTEMVKTIGGYVKEYVKSDEFIKNYNN